MSLLESRSVPRAADAEDSVLSELRAAIDHAAHLLPAQGPITAFVHHNTLHAFEGEPFDVAVQRGARIFDCHPYLPEDRYRELVAQERIREDDLRAILEDDLGIRGDEFIDGLGTRFALRLAMLRQPLPIASTHELRWLVAESNALHRFSETAPPPVRQRLIQETKHWILRDHPNGVPGSSESADRGLRGMLDSLFERFGRGRLDRWSDANWEAFTLHLLWRVCRQGVHAAPKTNPAHPGSARHRHLLLEATGEDSDQLVHPVLIRLCAAFLDQGYAEWPVPERAAGMFRVFLNLYGSPGGPPDRWMGGLRAELNRLSSARVAPLKSIWESLHDLGVADNELENFLAETLLALRGWAGMIWQMEIRGDRAARPAPRGSLIEFLAVRLILERVALADVARRTTGFRGPLRELRAFLRGCLPRPQSVPVEQRALLVFQLAQSLGWKPETLHRLSKEDWALLVHEIEAFSGIERRRIFQRAYERKYVHGLLDALSAHRQRPAQPGRTPSFQMITCIDDREESFRRHLEEVDLDCETFGYAGFFAVAMYYRGAADAHYLPLCPVIVRPEHYVDEEVVYTLEEEHRRRQKTRRALGTASHQIHVGSRTFLGGMLTAMFGSLASFPMVARILFPRLTARIRRRFGRLVATPPMTRLLLERTQAEPGPQPGRLGFSVAEMAAIVERALRDLGLTSRIARLVIVAGHGSSSLNNPHESAYNCGACAGGRGGPNARAFARMANDPRVRTLLRQNGIDIPTTTHFLGAYHNTCNDEVVVYDLDQLPSGHRADFQQARECIDAARERNAHERCRRFVSARLTLTPEEALRHVEARSEDLSQARPEYNHATNAATVVGRRQTTRGLFLDRRVFLASYDPEQDDADGTILARILQAVIPVCAGISLEYYFSCIDPVGWGCGSKLPHNVTSLLGVMEGAASDLRPGLSQQMIEIHEPMRQLFVVETTPEVMWGIVQRNETIRRLCLNDWVYLATLNPGTGELHLLQRGRFVPYVPDAVTLPTVENSVEWYRGWRDHLGFAAISAGAGGVR